MGMAVSKEPEPEPLGLFDLPAELRLLIYGHYFEADGEWCKEKDSLLLTCTQVLLESFPDFDTMVEEHLSKLERERDEFASLRGEKRWSRARLSYANTKAYNQCLEAYFKKKQLRYRIERRLAR